jgi:dTDP-4-dehydrorhamnose reductase
MEGTMKALILGDGKLATELQKQTGWDYISRKKDGFDLLRSKFYNDHYYIHLSDYDTIINCIGYTKTYENERKLNWDTNYVGVIRLVNFCNTYHKKLIHFSTDYVYANSLTRAEEDLPVHFRSWYSYTKLLADAYVQAVSNDYLLIRTTFKPRPFPWKTAWTNIRTNSDYVDVIADLIIKLIEKDAKGVYNVGTEPKTYYDLAKQTVPDCVPSCSKEFEDDLIVTMDLTKLKKFLNDNYPGT